MDDIDRKVKRLKTLTDNPNFISGIYNYCDRWCERCPMTARCLLYAQEKADDAEAGSEARDMENEAFWKRISDSFAVAMRMVSQDMKKRGIPAPTPEDEREFDARERRRDKRVEDADVTKQGMRYSELATKWFDTNAERFKEKGEEIKSAILMGIEGQNPQGEFDDLRDAVEVIRWYQYQIYVKLARAVGGREDDKDEPEDPEFPSDSDGSAKVALLAIDRSLAAWARMREHFPEAEGTILDLLVHLDRLRKRAEQEFPKARAFQRVGFDYMPEPKKVRKRKK